MNNSLSLTNAVKKDKGSCITTFSDDFCVIDIETTGLSASRDQIIELCALKVRSNKVVKIFSTLVKPETSISPFISRLTGITNQMVENSPLISDILDKYLEFIDNDVVVGHNVTFDINFIHEKSLQCYKRSFSNDYVDTCRLSRKITPIKHHKLDLVAQYYNVDPSGHHRAQKDCIMTFEIYKAMRKAFLVDV